MGKWTEEEKQYVQENYHVKTKKQLAEKLNRSYMSIKYYMRIMGFKITEEERKQRQEAATKLIARRNQLGSKNPNWKGGISKNNYHYKKLQVQRYPEKINARAKVHYAIKNGIIIKKACEVCGDQNSEAHHEDYSKPLDITWLCKTHHRQRHCS